MPRLQAKIMRFQAYKQKEKNHCSMILLLALSNQKTSEMFWRCQLVRYMEQHMLIQVHLETLLTQLSKKYLYKQEPLNFSSKSSINFMMASSLQKLILILQQIVLVESVFNKFSKEFIDFYKKLWQETLITVSIYQGGQIFSQNIQKISTESTYRNVQQVFYRTIPKLSKPQSILIKSKI